MWGPENHGGQRRACAACSGPSSPSADSRLSTAPPLQARGLPGPVEGRSLFLWRTPHPAPLLSVQVSTDSAKDVWWCWYAELRTLVLLPLAQLIPAQHVALGCCPLTPTRRQPESGATRTPQEPHSGWRSQTVPPPAAPTPPLVPPAEALSEPAPVCTPSRPPCSEPLCGHLLAGPVSGGAWLPSGQVLSGTPSLNR